MKAWTLRKRHATPHSVLIETHPRPQPAAGEALVRVSYAALNRRDWWIRLGLYPAIEFPSILGADAAGIVVAVGSPDATSAGWLGKSVVINPGLCWNDDAEETKDQANPGATFHVLGSAPAAGTLAEFIAVPISHLYEVPAHLTMSQAASLPLAGVTAFRAVFTKGCVKPGHRVLVTGAGGGVAAFCVQFATAIGAHVYVTTSSAGKLEASKLQGAVGGALYTDPNFVKQLNELVPERFDAVIDGAGGDQLNDYIRLLKTGGIISIYGATTGRPKQLDVARLFIKSVELRGSTMGSPSEFAGMIHLISDHRLVPVVDCVLEFSEIDRAFEKLRGSSQFGKVVVRVCGDNAHDEPREPVLPSKL